MCQPLARKRSRRLDALGNFLADGGDEELGRFKRYQIEDGKFGNHDKGTSNDSCLCKSEVVGVVQR